MTNKVSKYLLVLLFALVHVAIIREVYWLARDIVTGDGSVINLSVPLRYPPMRVPATPLTISLKAEGRLCADFAQIYFPAQKPHLIGSAYSSNSTFDPWLRESKYPPLMHLLCSFSLCKLPYGFAGIAHLGIQYLLFLVSFLHITTKLGLKKYLLPMILLLNICLFLTPVGLSWMERGQFSLYVGLSYLWLMLSIVTGVKKYAFIAAIFGFVKWTSFPFVFVASLVYAFNSRVMNDFMKRLSVPFIFVCVVLFLLCILYPEGLLFLKAVFKQEADYEALGITLVRVLPRAVVKVIPVLLIVIGLMERWSVKRSISYLLPFFTGSAVLLVVYPTFAFDYSVPCLTAFIPFLVYWATLPGVPKWLGNSMNVLFFAFLLAASFSIYLLFGSEEIVIVLYVVSAGCLVASCFLGNMSSCKEEVGLQQ